MTPQKTEVQRKNESKELRFFCWLAASLFLFSSYALYALNAPLHYAIGGGLFVVIITPIAVAALLLCLLSPLLLIDTLLFALMVLFDLIRRGLRWLGHRGYFPARTLWLRKYIHLAISVLELFVIFVPYRPTYKRIKQFMQMGQNKLRSIVKQ